MTWFHVCIVAVEMCPVRIQNVLSSMYSARVSLSAITTSTGLTLTGQGVQRAVSDIILCNRVQVMQSNQSSPHHI